MARMSILVGLLAVALVPAHARAQCCGFKDLGDGTIKDSCTGLQWEKKDGSDGTPNPADLHDVDNRYMWAGRCYSNGALCQPNAAAAASCVAHADGGTTGCSTCPKATCNVDPLRVGAITTVWDWLNQLNAANFAGHNDWRLPSEGGYNSPPTGSNELGTIVLAPYPCATSRRGCGPSSGAALRGRRRTRRTSSACGPARSVRGSRGCRSRWTARRR